MPIGTTMLMSELCGEYHDDELFKGDNVDINKLHQDKDSMITLDIRRMYYPQEGYRDNETLGVDFGSSTSGP